MVIKLGAQVNSFQHASLQISVYWFSLRWRTHKKKFRVTTDSKHHLPVAANLLNRHFAPTAPNQVWITDISYIPTNEGCLYLAAVKDLHPCEIVDWPLDSRMTQTLVMDALTAPYWKKKLSKSFTIVFDAMQK